MVKPLKIKLHVLSPIHIGCDDVYEPTSFVIDETRKKLIQFDPVDFIRHLTPEQRTEFLRICTGDNLLSIFKFVKRAFSQRMSGTEVEVASGLIEHYKKVLSMPTYDAKAIINQFTMNKTAYNPQTGQAYIPGTSLKGSLRTAYLSYLAVTKGKKNAREKAGELERELLGGSFETDPFRMIKVSDFQPLAQVQTRIVYAINKKKRIIDRETKASSGPLQIFEVIQRGGIFEGAINVDMPIKGAGIRSAIDQTTLFKACTDHYTNLFKQEMEVVRQYGYNQISFRDFKDRLGKTCFLIRIGRHSGAEAVTIDGNRNIKIMQGRGQPSKSLTYSTTVWLASESARPTANNGLVPFGWAILEVLPFDPGERLFGRAAPRRIRMEVPVENISERPITVSDTPAPRKERERTSWPGATLTYSPGNKTLVATYQSKKAELSIGDDRSMVPKELHKMVFEKRKGVKVNAVVEPLGNAFRIVAVSE